LEQQLNHRAWFEPPSKRLSMWRDFRKSLDTNNIFDVCNTVIAWWQTAPLVSIAIDPVNSAQWPTPWEMLHQGDFCEDSLALGMSYTIYYANPAIENQLLYLTCREKSFQRLCALIDNKYLLNFERGVISTLPTDETCTINYSTKIKDII
jgi:hypothetical protein